MFEYRHLSLLPFEVLQHILSFVPSQRNSPISRRPRQIRERPPNSRFTIGLRRFPHYLSPTRLLARWPFWFLLAYTFDLSTIERAKILWKSFTVMTTLYSASGWTFSGIPNLTAVPRYVPFTFRTHIPVTRFCSSRDPQFIWGIVEARAP